MVFLGPLLTAFQGLSWRLWTALGLVAATALAVTVGVYWLLSKGEEIATAKQTEQRIEAIQQKKKVTNEVKKLSPSATDKRLDYWMRD